MDPLSRRQRFKAERVRGRTDFGDRPRVGEEHLLRYFMLNPERILSKSRLTEHVYDQEFDRDSNLIEVYVRRLREKIGQQHIRTLRGQGYLFPEQAQ